jgi:hypothetical protein
MGGVFSARGKNAAPKTTKFVQEDNVMKVKFKYGINTYSGTLDQMVYGSYRDGNLCIGRQYVYPTLTAHNTALGSIVKNLAGIWAGATALFKADLKTYAGRYANEVIPKSQGAPSCYALFLKMMHAWADSDANIDLATLTAEDITASGTVMNTVKNCVDSGFLPAVSNYATLTAQF